MVPTATNLRDMARAATAVTGAALAISILACATYPTPFSQAGWLVACGLNAALLVVCVIGARRA